MKKDDKPEYAVIDIKPSSNDEATTRIYLAGLKKARDSMIDEIRGHLCSLGTVYGNKKTSKETEKQLQLC